MKNIEELREILKILQDRPTKAEVAQAIKAVLDFVKGLDLKKTLSGELKQTENALRSSLLRELLSETKKVEQKINGDVDNRSSKSSKELAQTVNKLEKTLRSEMAQIGRRIPAPANLEPVYERISNLRETVGEKDEATNKRIDELEREVEKIAKRPSVNAGGRRIFQPYQDDLSASCDGSNKTFYLSRAPLNNVIFVFGTDFPTILRPTIDFAVANKVLTLTSAVPAPNEGATLLIQYYA